MSSLEEAVEHIEAHSTHHSDAIVTKCWSCNFTLQIKWTLQLSMSMPQLVSPMVAIWSWLRNGGFNSGNCTRGPMGLKSWLATVCGHWWWTDKGVRDEDWIYWFGNMGASLAKSVLPEAKTGDDILLAPIVVKLRWMLSSPALVVRLPAMKKSLQKQMWFSQVLKASSVPDLLSQYQTILENERESSLISMVPLTLENSLSKSTPNYSYDAKYSCFYRSRSD